MGGRGFFVACEATMDTLQAARKPFSALAVVVASALFAAALVILKRLERVHETRMFWQNG